MSDALEQFSVEQCLQNVPFAVSIFNKNNEIIWANDLMARYLEMPAADICRLTTSPTQAEHIAAIFDGKPKLVLPASDAQPERYLKCHVRQQGMMTLRFYEDVTDKVEMKQRLETLSINDPVTGVLNQRGLFRDLEPLVSRSRRYGNVLSLFILSVDNLDTLTDISSDDVMLAISRLLRDETRWADMIGRLADNEFMIILPETGIDAAVTLSEKIVGKINDLNLPSAAAISVQCGNAEWQRGDDVSLLMKRARTELHAVQEGGRKAAV